MNSQIPSGAHNQPNVPMPHYSRRQQEYHQYQQHVMPQNHMPYMPYAYQYPPQYYGQQMPSPYSMPRWNPQAGYPPYSMPPQMHNAQRSPMVVSSQPHMPYSGVTGRAMQYPQHSPVAQPSPYANSYINTSAVSLPMSSPHEPPSSTSTPQPASRRASYVLQPQATTRMPFYPSLPWYSHEDGKHSFPPAAKRRRKRFRLQEVAIGVLLPLRAEQNAEPEMSDNAKEDVNVSTDIEDDTKQDSIPVESTEHDPIERKLQSSDTIEPEKDGNAGPEYEKDRTADSESHDKIISNGDGPRPTTRPPIPIIPALPFISAQKSVASNNVQQDTPQAMASSSGIEEEHVDDKAPRSDEGISAPAKTAPKSWADLVRSKGALSTGDPIVNGNTTLPGNGNSRADSIGEVLDHFDINADHKFAFLEPRGLVNTGNMCYMNSILQVLISCVPFYDFLDQVGKRAAHSFKSDTPLLDALIMFMREFSVIDSANSADQLRLRLKDKELEQYGDPLIPEYVYSAINRLPRFSSMRRGHQQDAEEFLGFLLAGLHDECVTVLRLQGITSQVDGPQSPTSTTSQTTDGWLEVGRKQKSAITRQSGDTSTTSPISKIFGGALRSELRVPGLKNSVTLEPYQPLQLDIGSPTINTITEALKGITKPETLSGLFNSPRGPGTTATKQVYIETLPPVLILHLKRFQYDSSGGTQKIWKRIGYPLEFEIPKEVFSPAKRSSLAPSGGSPRYRLISVVYHHGKSAAGGHYTVDLLRQDQKEWVRIDDTLIRRVRSEDVAEGGAEEDPKILAKALERHQQQQDTGQRNPYQGLEADAEIEDDGKAWSNVNGADRKRWAGIAAAATGATAGSVTPSTAGKQTPRRDNVKDNKVAYILLYQKMSS